MSNEQANEQTNKTRGVAEQLAGKRNLFSRRKYSACRDAERSSGSRMSDKDFVAKPSDQGASHHAIKDGCEQSFKDGITNWKFSGKRNFEYVSLLIYG